MNTLQNVGLSSLTVTDYETLDIEMAELESLRIRTELMLALQRYIQERQWSPEEAARAFRQSSPRMQNLINGEISRFSMEDLIHLLTKAGLKIQLSVLTPSVL
ncbi:XRE family transcriptional regulator [Leptolyngbya cf. ectocarpi LEGE 11479]|uniref:XRE family transcriptional regulator n=2 Tax=Leptolyngbya ectocarpi TaxID=1202 RepID=A0A928X137_LEPEC|nr:XRE family transcriptional regulator [Leptolyngbya cf. ectocarpi LEGE 11479]